MPTSAIPDAPPAEDEVDDPKRRRLILAASSTALIAVVASVSGLNVAQGRLAVELGASQNDLLWIINGYTIALAALLMPFGAIGDRWGRKKVLVSGLSLFVVANLTAAFSGSVTPLLVARVAGGAAAAMIMPATLSIITSSFPAGERDRAVGVWAGFAGAGGILGLFASSLVVDNVTWPWVFAMPIAFAVTGLVLTLAAVPHSREHFEHPFDTVGSILSALALGAVILGIHEGPESGWAEPLTITGLGVGALSLAGFVAWELRHPGPLLNLRLFRNRMLTAGSVSLLIAFGILGALFLVLVQFLQAVLGYSAVKAAAGLLPLALLIMPLATVAPRIAPRVGMRTMFTTGALLIAGGVALMAVFAETSYLSVLPGLLVLSAGVGLLMTPGTTAITSSLPADEQGVASALNDTVRELGTAFGVALIGSVLSASYRSGVSKAVAALPPEAASAVERGIGGAMAVAKQLGHAGEPIAAAARSAFVDAWSASMWLSTGLALAATLFALVWTPRPRQERADREANALASRMRPAPGAVEA